MTFIAKFIHSFNPSEPGFLFLWAILLLGIFGIAIIIERGIYLVVHSNFKAGFFMQEIFKLVLGNDITAAQKMCDNSPRMALSQIVKVALNEAGNGPEKIQNAVDEESLNVIPKLEKRTGYLAMVSNVATLLGLMGTIYGLIVSFAAVGQAGIDPAQKSALLAQGIAAAMNTTFMGLMIAIPCIFIYSFYHAKTQKIVDEIDEYSMRVVNVLTERSYKTHKYHISASQIKEGVGLHVTHNNIKIFTDNRLIKEINF